MIKNENNRKCLLYSNYNLDLRHWNGVSFEFIRTISEVEHATIVAPAGKIAALSSNPTTLDLFRELGLRANSRTRRSIHKVSAPRIERVSLAEDYDLSFFMFNHVHELREIGNVINWRERSKKAVAFIVEIWSSEFDKYKEELRLLDRFDHVFISNGTCIDKIKDYTKATISQLSVGSNCLYNAPDSDNSPRPIDIVSIGRRLPAVHEVLLALSRERGWFYYFDTWTNLRAIDWSEVREMNANLIRRSRFAIVWDPMVGNADKISKMGAEESLTARYFESAAGGAVILGSGSGSPEFARAFDWPDAVIELSKSGTGVRDLIVALDADCERTKLARRTNVVQSLRRHDWIFRWRTVLDRLNLCTTPTHDARVAALLKKAASIEGS